MSSLSLAFFFDLLFQNAFNIDSPAKSSYLKVASEGVPPCPSLFHPQ
ncbi:hypothetical protein PC116_g29209 [Phytophthora cactorum]|nr:hypothetical protein PC116_g29209 [Phytophthora cactorum]